jgi:hypothetical protein
MKSSEQTAIQKMVALLPIIEGSSYGKVNLPASIEFSSEQLHDLIAGLSALQGVADGESVIVRKEVVDFLIGVGPLDGQWFGDTTKKPLFWWRKYLHVKEANK